MKEAPSEYAQAMENGDAPKDPARAGFVGKGRPVGVVADPDGNRAERRAARRLARREAR